MASIRLGDWWQEGERAGRVLIALAVMVAGSCAVVVVGGTAMMVVRGWTPVPYADQWFDMLSRQSLTWRFLFAQHNEHRILFPRLIFALDHWLVSETYKFDLAVSFVIQALSALLIANLCKRDSLRSWLTWPLCVLVTATTLFSAIQYDNFLCGYQVQFFGVFLAGMMALCSIARVRSDRTAVIVFVVFATIATFTLANGLLCAYAAVPVAVLCRRSPAVTSWVAVTALVLTGVYLIGYVSPVQHTDPLLSLRDPTSLLLYSAAEIGSVFPVLIPALPRSAAVAAGLLAYPACAIWFLRLLRRGRSDSEALAFGIAIFLLVTSLMTAAGRSGMQSEYAFVSRYSTPVLLFWAVLLVTVVAETCARRSHLAGAVVLACLGWVLAIAHVQSRFEHTAVAEKRALAAVAPTILARVPDQVMMHRSDPFDTGVVMKWQTFLRAAHTSVFAPHWTRLDASDVRSAGVEPCRQDQLQVLQVGSRERPAWRLTGRLPDRHGDEARILMFDGNGETVGFGLGGFDAASIDRGASARWGRGDWWIGESQVDVADVEGYVLGDGRRATCKIPF